MVIYNLLFNNKFCYIMLKINSNIIYIRMNIIDFFDIDNEINKIHNKLNKRFIKLNNFSNNNTTYTSYSSDSQMINLPNGRLLGYSKILKNIDGKKYIEENYYIQFEKNIQYITKEDYNYLLKNTKLIK